MIGVGLLVCLIRSAVEVQSSSGAETEVMNLKIFMGETEKMQSNVLSASNAMGDIDNFIVKFRKIDLNDISKDGLSNIIKLHFLLNSGHNKSAERRYHSLMFIKIFWKMLYGYECFDARKGVQECKPCKIDVFYVIKIERIINLWNLMRDKEHRRCFEHIILKIITRVPFSNNVTLFEVLNRIDLKFDDFLLKLSNSNISVDPRLSSCVVNLSLFDLLASLLILFIEHYDNDKLVCLNQNLLLCIRKNGMHLNFKYDSVLNNVFWLSHIPEIFICECKSLSKTRTVYIIKEIYENNSKDGSEIIRMSVCGDYRKLSLYAVINILEIVFELKTEKKIRIAVFMKTAYDLLEKYHRSAIDLRIFGKVAIKFLINEGSDIVFDRTEFDFEFFRKLMDFCTLYMSFALLKYENLVLEEKVLESTIKRFSTVVKRILRKPYLFHSARREFYLSYNCMFEDIKPKIKIIGNYINLSHFKSKVNAFFTAKMIIFIQDFEHQKECKFTYLHRIMKHAMIIDEEHYKKSEVHGGESTAN